jgi:molybdopterin-guanine dinucleotide biosynthesis protein A
LAGGRNSRMEGRNKALLQVGGQSILDRLLASLAPIFSEIMLVTRQPERYAAWPLEIVRDIYEARSSLTGIHAGLFHAQCDYAFVVPCDAPFLKPALIRLLLDELEPATDIVVPAVDGHFQPLCAIYSKRCLPAIETQLENGDYKIIRFFNQMTVKPISARKIKQVDPQMHSFFNVNTPSAYAASKELIKDIRSV